MCSPCSYYTHPHQHCTWPQVGVFPQYCNLRSLNITRKCLKKAGLTHQLMAEPCRSVLCWFILSRLQCSVICMYLWFKQLLTHWCNACLSYHNLWRVPFVRCLLKSKIRNYSRGKKRERKKKKKEPSRVAKTGNRKGHLLFWKLWGIVPGLCEWCIACALLLFPSNIWLWPVLLMEWGFCSLALWTPSFHQDHSTLL